MFLHQRTLLFFLCFCWKRLSIESFSFLKDRRSTIGQFILFSNFFSSPPLANAFTKMNTSHMARPKVALVTGATDGIGLTTAKQLARSVQYLIIHGRSEERIQQAKQVVIDFIHKDGHLLPTILTVQADLSTVSQCVQLSRNVHEILKQEGLSKLDILLHNAGVFSERHIISPEDDTEQTFAVNVVAPFVITSQLLPLLLEKKNASSPPSRIVIASSISQDEGIDGIDHWDDIHCLHQAFDSHKAYSESKLLDAMLSMELAKRFLDAGIATDRVTCNCLDPGTVQTKMLRAGWGDYPGINVEEALDETWLCTSEDVNQITGAYFLDRKNIPASHHAYNPVERLKLWNLLSNLSPESAASWESLVGYQS